MSRVLVSLVVALCVAAGAVGAAEVDEKPGEAAADAAVRTNEPADELPPAQRLMEPGPGVGAAPRLVVVEVLIADVRWKDGEQGIAADPTIDPEALLRDLEQSDKLDSLTRVRLTTIEGQKAFLHMGRRIPRATAAQLTQHGEVRSVTLENVGLIVSVTPQVRPDGLIVVAIEVEGSQMRPGEEGAVIARPRDRDPIHSPPMETAVTRTTISAPSGQSVVAGMHQAAQNGRRSQLWIVVTPELLGCEPPATAAAQE